MAELPHVVILGAGFAGLTAARRLRRAPVRVTVLDQRNHHLFQPLLYQVATAGLSPGEIAYPIRGALRRQKNTQVWLAEARAIDPERRLVELPDGVVSYDFLIVAAGSTSSYFGHDDWAPYARSLKSLEDALDIRRRILLAFERAERENDARLRQELLTFVIVGGGPTGVELAGAIADISRRVMSEDFRAIDPGDARIVLIEMGARLLPTFAPALSRKAATALAGMGVEVRLNTKVTGITAEEVTLAGERLRTRTAIWAAGIAASPLAQCLGVKLDRQGRVPVEPDLSLAAHPEIFVIGDLASFTHQTGQPLPGLAPVALQMGRQAARNIARLTTGQPSEPFHYVDKGSLATIGRAQAVAQFGRLQFSGFSAWLLWMSVHIFFLVGFRNRVIVSLEWMWDYASFQRGARLITGDLGGLEVTARAAADSTRERAG